MTVRFSSVFKGDLLAAGTRYAALSPKLGDDFLLRVKEAVRTAVMRGGGDHVGRMDSGAEMSPVPYLAYYEREGDDLFVLGLVQERKHPDSLQSELKKAGEDREATSTSSPTINPSGCTPDGPGGVSNIFFSETC